MKKCYVNLIHDWLCTAAEADANLIFWKQLHTAAKYTLWSTFQAPNNIIINLTDNI